MVFKAFIYDYYSANYQLRRKLLVYIFPFINRDEVIYCSPRQKYYDVLNVNICILCFDSWIRYTQRKHGLHSKRPAHIINQAFQLLFFFYLLSSSCFTKCSSAQLLFSVTFLRGNEKHDSRFC